MKLERYLVLNQYFLRLFGFNSTKELLKKLSGFDEGLDSDGHSYIVTVLRGLNPPGVTSDDLLNYDKNIAEYIEKINKHRSPKDKIKLKYFQYLALFFTEVFFDKLKNKKEEFLRELNAFLEYYKKTQETPSINNFKVFSEGDLLKLAFWMATGSGKTIIANINYYQFLKYQLFSPDNIIFITPNERLSEQHFKDLQKSGIPCRLYAESFGGGDSGRNEVLVIEITKFVEEKTGKGVTCQVDAFEGRNLLFVDEGHKGRMSDEQKWVQLRNKLAERGFVFEYSATFEQILSEKDEELLQEYAKAIIFDYSYKHFYLEGYGKDFSVLNFPRSKLTEQDFKTMFVANLLSFYEQLKVYTKNKDEAKRYNIAKPLWLFVGTTVVGRKDKTGKTSEAEKKTISDIQQILGFIRDVIEDEERLRFEVESLLDENRGDPRFNKKFKYLRTEKMDFDDLYNSVFGGRGKFRVCELKLADGEFGLKVGDNDYFGVVDIGDPSNLRKELEKAGITIESEKFTPSLFGGIEKDDSKVNLLIGAKKFIEGWNTWRASSMGLLNVGTGQGPQIIQLFGRGIRLKGAGNSLKRSGIIPLNLLETLNIYGVKADYIHTFLETLITEGVNFETIEIPVMPKHEPWHLYTLSREETFDAKSVLKLWIDSTIKFAVDYLQPIEVYQSNEAREGITKTEVDAKKEWRLQSDDISILNWDQILVAVYNFKVLRGYWNFVFDRETLQELLRSERYVIKGSIEALKTMNKEKYLNAMEELASSIIQKYIDLFYRKRVREFETGNMKFVPLEKQSALSAFGKSDKDQWSYIIKIEADKKQVIDQIKQLAKDFEELCTKEGKTLPRIYFENHLFLPLLLEDKEISGISPTGLNESEQKCLRMLRDYLKARGGEQSEEIYVLRNFPKSGVGFQLRWGGFYPDFIMWIKTAEKQIIVFLDPKGLLHTKGLDDEKIVFATNELKGIEHNLKKEITNCQISLESFILSDTGYQTLIKGMHSPPKIEDYTKNHVLFLEDPQWPKNLFQFLLKP
jgi:hypothetical protein